MFKHYITYAFRRLLKNKLYTSLNLFGLSIGLACFAMIGAWVRMEFSFDRFHEKGDRIYRVVGKLNDEVSYVDMATTSPPWGPALASEIPEIQKAIRVDPVDNVIAVGDKKILEDGIVTDQAFLDMFDFKTMNGNRATMLTEPYSIVLSESLAKKYFGDADPVGQMMRIFRYDRDNNGAEFKVTGVVEDKPDNTHFPIHFIISFVTWETFNPQVLNVDGWYNDTVYTYLLLNPNADPAAVQAKLPGMVEKYMGAKTPDGRLKFEYTLQPLTDIHLYSNLSYEMGVNGSITYVIIFGSIGIIVLLLACINYINLSTSYATEQLKEVGIHKVMGALKRQLIAQYLIESWMLATFALILAVGWMELARPLFEGLTGTKLQGLYTLQSLALLSAIASAVGLVSGFYPALILSNSKPTSVLKGQPLGVSRTGLRKILVVAQFSITIILVIGILGVNMQMQFIQNKDLGFDKENLVVFGVHGSPEIYKSYNAFVDELMTHPTIKGVTRSNTTLGSSIGASTAKTEDVDGRPVSANVYRIRMDYEYLDVYNMKLLAGRNFRLDNPGDSTRAFLVNEAAIRNFGYTNPQDAIGKPFNYANRQGEIIGVVKDFNFHSLQHKIEPFCAFMLTGAYSRITIKINGDTKKGFDDITTLWRKHFPNTVIQYAFYEDTLASQYQAESRFSAIFLVFSIISLVIACLGLFALVSYNVERRSKEIGIRKVLGASVASILTMISAEFIWLIVVASVVAIPTGYYFMDEWLTGFAYHISLNGLMFVGAGLIVLLVAWATVTLRTFRAASANPVDSLRSE